MVVPGQRPVTQPLLSMPVYHPAGTLSDTTRQLCCAPYVDVEFADKVIHEVVEAERKAVPPSYGFDLDPVVRHSLRARRLQIIRYAMVTGLLVGGLILNPAVTIGWLLLCAVVVGLRSWAARALPPALRVLFGVVAAIVILCVAASAIASAVIGQLASSAGLGGLAGSGSSVADAAGLFGGAARQGLLVLVAAGTFLALFLSRRHTYGIVATELAPGAVASAPRTGNPRVERRLAIVAAMQRGNIAVHDIDPYAGAGFPYYSWSFAVTLKPAGSDDRPRRNGRRAAVHLDTMALNRRVSDAIIALRDTRLREGERIPNVFVVPYVAADGNRRYDDPLIDPQTRTPRTLASPETLAAIEACPQGGLRHYLRAVIPANGKEIRTADGRLVLPAQDSGIGVTAFVHLAVEGGMLYAEFVATVMPQVDPRFHLVDKLRPERVQTRAAMDTLREFLRDNLLAPVFLIRSGWNAIRLQSRMARSASAADEWRTYDYGASTSVRELGAEMPTTKFMQRLDAAKYIKLLDRAIAESIVEFLDENGIDTSEFVQAVMNVTNNFAGAFINDSIVNFGGTNTNTQNNNRGADDRRTAAPNPGSSGGRARA